MRTTKRTSIGISSWKGLAGLSLFTSWQWLGTHALSPYAAMLDSSKVTGFPINREMLGAKVALSSHQRGSSGGGINGSSSGRSDSCDCGGEPATSVSP